MLSVSCHRFLDVAVTAEVLSCTYCTTILLSVDHWGPTVMSLFLALRICRRWDLCDKICTYKGVLNLVEVGYLRLGRL